MNQQEMINELLKRPKQVLAERIVELTRICDVETNKLRTAESALAALKESLGAAQFERRAASVADSICQYLKLPIGESAWRQIVLEVQHALAAAQAETKQFRDFNLELADQLAAAHRQLEEMGAAFDMVIWSMDNYADFRNGNTHDGMDEGEVVQARYLEPIADLVRASRQRMREKAALAPRR